MMKRTYHLIATGVDGTETGRREITIDRAGWLRFLRDLEDNQGWRITRTRRDGFDMGNGTGRKLEIYRED